MSHFKYFIPIPTNLKISVSNCCGKPLLVNTSPHSKTIMNCNAPLEFEFASYFVGGQSCALSTDSNLRS